MNIKQASEFLKISERTIFRHVKSGKLMATHIVGANGKQLDFDEADLAAFKSAPVAPMTPMPAPSLAPPVTAMTTAIVPHVTPDATLKNNALAISEAMTAPDNQLSQRVPLVDKMALSMDEAAQLSGVSKSLLNQARRDGKLRARRIGHGYKVRPADLAVFVESLFE